MNTVPSEDARAQGGAVSSLPLRSFDVGEPARAAQTGHKRRVLIVEDNSWIALLMAEEVTELGCAVVGPARSLSDALTMARGENLDAALVDINLGQDTAFPLAEVLADRNIPFTFITGVSEAPDAPFQDVPVLPKPFGSAGLRRVLADMLG
jgi:CheY-like chemotaxis protein